jgi:hypothetical protein
MAGTPAQSLRLTVNIFCDDFLTLRMFFFLDR